MTSPGPGSRVAMRRNRRLSNPAARADPKLKRRIGLCRRRRSDRVRQLGDPLGSADKANAAAERHLGLRTAGDQFVGEQRGVVGVGIEIDERAAQVGMLGREDAAQAPHHGSGGSFGCFVLHLLCAPTVTIQSRGTILSQRSPSD